MPKFSYTARTAQGEVSEGTVDAISLQAARDALRQMHLEPEELHETTSSEQSPSAPEPPPPPVAAPAILFTKEPDTVPPPPPIPSATVPPKPANARQEQMKAEHIYFPLIDTLRLYAGWLLAWYALVYALGSYQGSRSLPFALPYVDGLFLSPLVLSFTLATFLFLLFTDIWKLFGSGWKSGLLLTCAAVACFLLYRTNIA